VQDIFFDKVLSILQPRPVDSHKGVFGRLLNISGSSRYRGAAVLGCMGALRAGTGLCILASVPDVCSAAAAQLPEVIFCPLPACKKGYIKYNKAISILKDEVPHASAILFGCGLGNDRHTVKLLEFLLKNTNHQGKTIPLIIDADGLNALAQNIFLLKQLGLHQSGLNQSIILTPHLGEMARLCKVSAFDINGDRAGYAARFAKEYGVTLVLKGHDTIVAGSDGSMYINTTGNPGLAKGGSGDVLAGIIAAFHAQGINSVDACICAVYLHGLAADRAASRHGQYSMLPGEITIDLAQIFAENGR
jgi:NAD(P)H-hydrate epimerase